MLLLLGWSNGDVSGVMKDALSFLLKKNNCPFDTHTQFRGQGNKTYLKIFLYDFPLFYLSLYPHNEERGSTVAPPGKVVVLTLSK